MGMCLCQSCGGCAMLCWLHPRALTPGGSELDPQGGQSCLQHRGSKGTRISSRDLCGFTLRCFSATTFCLKSPCQSQDPTNFTGMPKVIISLVCSCFQPCPRCDSEGAMAELLRRDFKQSVEMQRVLQKKTERILGGWLGKPNTSLF